MLKIRPELYFINILISIDKINRYTRGLNLDQFISNEAAFTIAVRELQEIGENVKRLSQNPELIESIAVEWKKVIAFRNVAVHEYFKLIPEIVFDIIKNEIPEFEKDYLVFLKRKDSKTLLLEAFAETKAIFAKMSRNETVEYLEKIEELLKS